MRNPRSKEETEQQRSFTATIERIRKINIQTLRFSD